MLHSVNKPSPLTDNELRGAISSAINNEGGAKFVYDPDVLLPKLERHGVSIQDLLCICQSWVWRRETRWDKNTWRYKIEGEDLDGHWMAVVIAVYTNPVKCVAVTGFRVSRGRRKKP